MCVYARMNVCMYNVCIMDVIHNPYVTCYSAAFWQTQQASFQRSLWHP